MGKLDWLEEKYIYLVVLALLVLLLAVMYVFHTGGMDPESAKVYVQALTAVATLALLYYAYFNVASKKEEDIVRLELAVRPIFIWELESKNGGAQLAYKTIKHPIYDFHATIGIRGKTMDLQERHLDVSDIRPDAQKKADISEFIANGLGSRDMQLMRLDFSYHSEVGGRYEFSFTKEVVRKQRGFSFQHRKIISAKYPWRPEPVRFDQ